MEKRFGKKQVVSVGSFTTMKLKGALKDLDRQFENNVSLANIITSMIDDKDSTMLDLYKRSAKEPKLKEFIKTNSDIFHLMPSILNQPKAKSIHPCAVVILPSVMASEEWTPVRLQNGLIVTEWGGDEMEDAGFLKEDILGIKQLDKFADILKLIEENGKEVPNIYNLPHDDEVYRYFSNGWNGDVFQMGTDPLSAYTKYLKPDSIEDLIATVSLYRPGPMENNYHNVYVKCKNEGRVSKYLWGTEEITKDTYGILCYQEQIMAVCQQLGNLTMQEADDVRRAMGKKNLKYLAVWEDRLREGYLQNGATKEQFQEAWNVMVEFAKYSFNRCLSGKTVIKRFGQGNKYAPTIEEMYKLKNNGLEYAKSVGKVPLRMKYIQKGYGKSFSLNENNQLVKNDIVDIRYEGKKETFRLTLENGSFIDATCNHKFPTSNGQKRLDEIDIEKDLIFNFNGTIKRKIVFKDEHLKEGYVLNSKKGHGGFVKKEPLSTNSLKLKYYKENLKTNSCEKCSKTNCRLEVHHIDGNHCTNNDFDNLETLCVSCHKKEHYKMGRTKAGDLPFSTKLLKIVSIESNGFEDVYDVEMAKPNHTFTIDNGIVTCNSHAACYAKTGYVCQWLKVNYPLEYWTVSLSYADETKGLKFLSEIFEAKGIEVSPPDINNSDIHMVSDNETNTIYWGIESIKGIGEETAKQIINIRKTGGNYKSFADFYFRNCFKGSKVKKQTYEALITSGAFDILYNLQGSEERRNFLINRFRRFHKVRIVSPERDLFMKGSVKEKWWWKLQQKKFTGISFMDFKEVAKQKGINTQFCSNRDLTLNQNRGVFRAFGGYVIDIKKRRSSRGSFAFLTIENNYRIYKLILWSDEYKAFKKQVDNSEKSFILFDAELKFESKWDKRNVFTLQNNSNLIILN